MKTILHRLSLFLIIVLLFALPAKSEMLFSGNTAISRSDNVLDLFFSTTDVEVIKSYVVGKGTLPEGGKGRRHGQVEVYGQGRFFTVTGQTIMEDRMLRDCTEEITAVISRFIDQPQSTAKKQVSANVKASASVPSDKALLKRAFQSKNGERLNALWNGRWQENYASQSEADLALCSMLSFWAGRDFERVDRLFRQSGLYRAEKWDEVHGVATYGQMTINKALDGLTTSDDAAGHNPCYERYTQAYASVDGYSSVNGKLLAEIVGNGGEITTRTLANFSCLITEEVTSDDGIEAQKSFALEGITQSGAPLPSAQIPAARFANMAWSMETWGADAIIHPGTSIKDKVRYEAGVLSDMQPYWAQGVEIIFDHSEGQRQAIAEEQPVDMFLNALAEMNAVGTILIGNIQNGATDELSDDRRIGYADADYIYLLPGVTYAAVQRHFQSQGNTFPIGKSQLWNRLVEAGIAEGQGKNTTRTKHIPGVGSQRAVWIRKSAVPELFDGTHDATRRLPF